MIRKRFNLSNYPPIANLPIALQVLLEGRTSLMVVHRLSTIRNADHIVVLDHGQIQEVGIMNN
ncbi:hypothetical protein [Paenibacillus sp. NPDC055715]